MVDEMHLSHKKSGGVKLKPDRFSIVNDISLITEISALSCARPGLMPSQLEVRIRVRRACWNIELGSILQFRICVEFRIVVVCKRRHF
jgi:hypothetical protein